MASARSKDKYKEYKTSGKREAHKVARFERWIKSFIKQSKSSRGIYVSAKNKTDSDGVKSRISAEYKHTWTFGPFGKHKGGKFEEKIPTWMTPLVDKYKEYYNTEPKPKKIKARLKAQTEDKVINGKVVTVKK